MTGKTALTRADTEQQDFVDNTIFDMVKKLVPEAEWDIGVISPIREILINAYKLNEALFYPYIGE
jgi:hypothetical protein